MSNSIPIRVEIQGTRNGHVRFESIKMEAEIDESLVSIVERLETELENIVVKSIRFD